VYSLFKTEINDLVLFSIIIWEEAKNSSANGNLSTRPSKSLGGIIFNAMMELVVFVLSSFRFAPIYFFDLRSLSKVRFTAIPKSPAPYTMRFFLSDDFVLLYWKNILIKVRYVVKPVKAKRLYTMITLVGIIAGILDAIMINLIANRIIIL